LFIKSKAKAKSEAHLGPKCCLSSRANITLATREMQTCIQG